MPPLTESGNNGDSGLEALLPKRIRKRLYFINSAENSVNSSPVSPEPVALPESALRREKLFSRIKIRAGQYDGPSEDPKPAPSVSTVPRRNLSRKSAALHRRPSLIAFGHISSTSKSAGSHKSLDRFLPSRRPTLEHAVESFRSNKNYEALSPDERLLRNKKASSDAFIPRRVVSSPISRSSKSTPTRTFSGNRNRSGGASILAFHRDAAGTSGERQVSVGTVWTVGGLAPVSSAVPDGRGGFLGSGTNAPMYTTPFAAGRKRPEEDNERHESRLAEALDLDRVSRVLEFRGHSPSPRRPRLSDKSKSVEAAPKTVWKGTEWVPGSSTRILDAPHLRDDFYCSVLAYSATCHTLAVGLGSFLYAWSETKGVSLLHNGSHNGAQNGSWLTSIAFSSAQGCKCILAFGRSDGTLRFMSLYDNEDIRTKMIPTRFEIQHLYPIACIMWKPSFTIRPSRCPMNPGVLVKTEDLLVGDEVGCVSYYAVEWPDNWEVTQNGWAGSIVLLARITAHAQQICGLAFSVDGELFASGGNDNLCCLFQTCEVLQNTHETAEEIFNGIIGSRNDHIMTIDTTAKHIKASSEKHRWVHGAAVKAIAFCPWRNGLIATGGGSNDKCIHFFHTPSGACLATISVAAQVTSLIWSTTRREIVATFGYAQPDHPYRIAVFSWPDCKQVAAIPWEGEHRALYATRYQGGPNESQTSREGGRSLTRTALEGCIVVASSDESLKFHEVWSAGQKATIGGGGLLGGSDILEGLDGIDKEGEIIR